MQTQRECADLPPGRGGVSQSDPCRRDAQCIRNHQWDEWPGQKKEEGWREGSLRGDEVSRLTCFVEAEQGQR